MVYRMAKGPDKMRRLRLGDKVLRVRDEPEPPPGSERSPPPLVLIHGAGMSSVVWIDFLRRLAPARRVVAPDLPGHGQSDRWHDKLSIPGYAEAVGTVCATLKIGRAVLIGHSMGAAVALSCALSWPERVAGLILLNGAGQLDVSDEVMALLGDSLPPAAPDSTAVDERVDRMSPAFGDLCFSPATAPELRERWQAVLFSARREVILGDFAACRGFDLLGELPRLNSAAFPSLLISGGDDLLVPPQLVAETAARLLRARHEVIADSGHLTHLEKPAACFALIEGFLRESR